MTDAGFFRGTSAEQDNRFSDKHKKLLKQMKFADSLSLKVDTSKVDLDVLRPWVTKRVTEILGMEDEVVAEFVMNQLEADKTPDPKTMQINLTGFLNGRHAREFMGELWTLLHSASNSPNGIPEQLIEAKKQEILAREEAKKDKSNDVLSELQPVNGSNQAPTQMESTKQSSRTDSLSPARRRSGDHNSPNARKRSVSPRRRSRSPRKSRSPERRRSRSPPKSRSSERRRSRSPRHHGHRHHRHHRRHSSHRKRHYRDDSRSEKSRRRDRERERREERPRRERDRESERHRSKKSRYSSSPSVTSDSSSSSSGSSSSSSHHHTSSSSRQRRKRSRSREGKGGSRNSPSRSHGSKSGDHERRKESSSSKKRSPSPLEEELSLRETALKSLRNKSE